MCTFEFAIESPFFHFDCISKPVYLYKILSKITLMALAISKLIFLLNIAMLMALCFHINFKWEVTKAGFKPSYNIWAAQNSFRIRDTICKFVTIFFKKNCSALT